MIDKQLLSRAHRELLDVLNSINQDKIHHDGDDFHELLNDVEEALAQPEQEPVCPACKAEVLYECVACSSNNYPPPQRTEPLATIRQAIANDAWAISFQTFGQYRTALLKLIDATLPQPEQEPVAWEQFYTTAPQRTEPLIGCINHDCDKCKENT